MAVANKLKDISKAREKRERFITARMWFSTFLSSFYQDRGKIPPNIGNDILIVNNQYATKNHLSAMLVIQEMSENTPIAFMSDMRKDVKTKVRGVKINFSIKGHKYQPDIHSSGLSSRISQWEKTLDNPNAYETTQARAARLLYSHDIIKTGEKCLKAIVYVTIRAKDGRQLQRGIKECENYLDSIGASFKTIKSDIETHLKYNAILSNKEGKKIRDLNRVIFSSTTLAQVLPATQGINDVEGSFMGINRLNRFPYFINFKESANAKNIYVTGLSGNGKTFLVISWLIDFFALNFNLCIMDLKGNEFSHLTKACNGVTLSMRPESTKYVNTFKMSPNGVVDYKTYFNEQLKLSKMILTLVVNASEEHESKLSALLESFLQSVYKQIGVISDNPKTWYRTEVLNPYVIFEKFMEYLSEDIKRNYHDIIDIVTDRFRMYLSKDGSASHIFREEYSLDEVLNSRVLTFDFGLLNSSRVQDATSFKIRLLYMQLINNEFSRYKKSKGEWTVKVLEESQLAEDFLLRIYGEELSLRRAQNQITVMLGNSIAALDNNPMARTIIDNINILVVGVVHKSSREILIREFGLEEHAKRLERIADDPEYDRTFLLVNKMQKKAAVALIKAYVPEKVSKGSLYKTVDTI